MSVELLGYIDSELHKDQRHRDQSFGGRLRNSYQKKLPGNVVWIGADEGFPENGLGVLAAEAILGAGTDDPREINAKWEKMVTDVVKPVLDAMDNDSEDKETQIEGINKWIDAFNERMKEIGIKFDKIGSKNEDSEDEVGEDEDEAVFALIKDILSAKETLKRFFTGKQTKPIGQKFSAEFDPLWRTFKRINREIDDDYAKLMAQQPQSDKAKKEFVDATFRKFSSLGRDIGRTVKKVTDLRPMWKKADAQLAAIFRRNA